MITLEHLLESRDNRSRLQLQLIGENPDKTLVCLTVVMPGNVKRNARSLKVAAAAVEAIREVFGEVNLIKDLVTGYEAYILTAMPPEDAKLKACEIEESHPLGRLFDIDVIDNKGKIISRTSLNFPERKCIVCGNNARVCMRLQTHNYSTLLTSIAKLIDSYDLRN